MQFAAIPYCGPAPVPAQLWAQWNFDPLLLAVLAAALLLCRMHGARPVPLTWGFVTLAVLFVSPLCALTSALFSARVAHHVLLTAVAAPLIAAALPRTSRNLTGWILGHTAIFWAWHTPSAYAFALSSDAAYWLMQASLLGSAIGFWQAVRSASVPARVAGLLAMMLQMGLLGALLTFAGKPLYAWHAITTRHWGLTPLEDQQLAGLVMWVPGGALYLAAALWLAYGWLGEDRRLSAT